MLRVRLPLLFTAAGLAGAWLPGCAYVGSSPTPSAPSAASLGGLAASPASATDLVAWWDAFADPTLSALAQRAVAGNLDLQTARTRVEAAAARRGVSAAALGPQVSATGSAGSQQVRSDTATSRSRSFQGGLTASWQLDLFGQTRLAVASAQAEWESAEETARAAQITVIAEVASAYISLRATEAQIARLEENLVLQRQTTAAIGWQHEAGTATRLEWEQARSTLAQAEASLPALQQTLEETRTSLCLLCGLTPQSLEGVLTPTAQIPAAPALTAGLPTELLRQRPDLRAAEKTFSAAWYQGEATRRQRFPSLTLTGSLTAQSSTWSDLFDPQAVARNVAAGLTAPLFTSGQITQSIAVQDAAVREANLAYQTAVLTAYAEVSNALTALQHTQARWQQLQSAQGSAQTAYTLARARYEAGEVDLLTLLDAQRTRLSVDEAVTEAAAAHAQAAIQLYTRLGGGWTQPDLSS